MRAILLIFLLIISSPSFADQFKYSPYTGKLDNIGPAAPMSSVGGNVGIGSTNPQCLLDLGSGSVCINGVSIASSANVGIGTANNVVVYTGTSTAGPANKFVVLPGGNVGIGTTSPMGGLAVMNGNVGIGTWAPVAMIEGLLSPDATGQAKVAAQLGYIPGNNGGSTILRIYAQSTASASEFEQNNTGNASNRRYGTFGDTNIVNNYSNAVQPYGNINFVTANGASQAVRMTIGANSQAGNVGIGTTTPAGALTVMNGNVGIGTWVPVYALSVVGNVGINTTAPTADLEIANPNIANVKITRPGFPSGTMTLSSGSSGSSMTSAGTFSITAASGNVLSSEGARIVFGASGTTANTTRLQNNGSIASGLTYYTSNAPASGAIIEGNVGIGTFLPSSLLEVGNQKFNILSNGNVGIGTTTAQNNFTIYGGNVGIGTFTNTDPLGGGNTNLISIVNGTGIAPTNILNIDDMHTSGAQTPVFVSSKTTGSNTVFDGENNAANDAIRLEANGSSAPGTSAPGIAYANSSVLAMSPVSGSNAIIEIPNGNRYFAITKNGAALIFADTNSNVGIGTAGPQAGLSVAGHIHTHGTAPTVANNDCGTTSQGTVAARSTDVAGTVTVGTLAVTSCAMTFNTTWLNAPICVASDDSNVLAIKAATSTTKLTFTSTSSMSSDVLSYICFGDE